MKILMNSFSLFLVLCFFSACKKDKDDVIVPKPVQKLVSRIEQDANNYLAFEYNADKTLSKLTAASNEPGDEYNNQYIFSYDQKKISKVVIDDKVFIAYDYENGKLWRTRTTDPKGATIAEATFYYKNNRLDEYTVFGPFAGEEEGVIIYRPVTKSNYTYNSNGTIKTETMLALNPINNKMENAGTRYYDEYDTRINPLIQLGDFALGFFQEVNKHNSLKHRYLDKDGAILEQTRSTYQYDEAGYPTQSSVSVTDESGITIEKKFRISYK